MSDCEIDSEIFIEIFVRTVIWIIHFTLDKVPPFIREISECEKWLYCYPNRPSYVSSRNLWITIIIVPSILFGIEYYITGNNEDIIKAILTITLSYGLNGAITGFIKILVGRPRPNFCERCFPDNAITDFKKCTGDPLKVNDGRKSFPSGHASFSFTCFVFLSLYIARKVELWTAYTGQSWRFCLSIIPLLISSAISISRTCDYNHHYQDVFAGSCLGTILGYVTFKLYFPEQL